MMNLKRGNWITILKKADWLNCFVIMPLTVGSGIGCSIRREFLYSLGYVVLFCAGYCTHLLYKRTIQDLKSPEV